LVKIQQQKHAKNVRALNIRIPFQIHVSNAQINFQTVQNALLISLAKKQFKTFVYDVLMGIA